MADIELLKKKVKSIWKDTLWLHKLAPETRLASSLSCIEILVALYYGKILKFDPKNTFWDGRDRFIVSKGHGTVSMYPILADLGFFDKEELENICQQGSFLGSIPDPTIPGYETINGSLGLGLGVACGSAIALKRENKANKVFVLSGDGELYEGCVWEAVMFAAHNQLDNLIMIIDNNKICMMDYCKNIINIEPLEEKFKTFGWDVSIVDGHNIKDTFEVISGVKASKINKPKVIIANTIKGKGVACLENDSLCHIRMLKKEVIEEILEKSNE